MDFIAVLRLRFRSLNFSTAHRGSFSTSGAHSRCLPITFSLFQVREVLAMCDGDSAERPACLSASCAYRKTQQSTNSSSFTCRLKWFQKLNYLWAPILKAGASCQFPYSPKALCSALHVFVVCIWFLNFDFLKLQHSCSRKAEAVSGTWCCAGLFVQLHLAAYTD